MAVKHRKRTKYAQRIPWVKACELVGEDSLKHDFTTGKPFAKQRVTNWRRDGVPGQEVAIRLISLLESEPTNAELRTLTQVRSLHERYGADSEAWTALTALLKVSLHRV